MTAESRDMDYLAARFIADAAPEDKPALAQAFGEADIIGRHLPAYVLPAAVRSCWLAFVALEAERRADPWATVLREAATAALMEAAGPMEVLVVRSPDDARGLT